MLSFIANMSCSALTAPLLIVALVMLMRGMPTHRELGDLEDAHLRMFSRIGALLLIGASALWCGWLWISLW